jgi:phosphoglycerate dehydrogenase-like enzyme
MTPTIVLPDGDPHMAALLSRPDFAARIDRLGGARLQPDLPNVVLSPHQGYNTPESLERMIDVVVANIENYLAGTPANIVAAVGPR